MKENIKKLIEKYEGLKESHFINEGDVQMIDRKGIEVIEKQENIHIMVSCQQAGVGFAVVSANAWLGLKPSLDKAYSPDATAIASASELTTLPKQHHYAEIAEARARARVVLKLAGIYLEGIFSEEEIVPEAKAEADPVSEAKKSLPKAVTGKQVYIKNSFCPTGKVDFKGKVFDVVSEGDGIVETLLYKIPKDDCVVWSVADRPYLVYPRSNKDNATLLTALTKAGFTDLKGSYYETNPEAFLDPKRNTAKFTDIKDFVLKATVSNILTLITNPKNK